VETIAVDWSGAADARRQIAMARAQDGELVEIVTGRSREEVVETLVDRSRDTQGRLAVGLDFAFSMPAWFLRERGVDTARRLWELVAREGEVWLWQEQVPFWGRRRPRPVLEAYLRRTEQRLRPVAGISVKSPFQIGGAGAVGTASLRGMPFLAVLQDAGFSVWPFDPPRLPLVVEIYPRLLTGPVNKRAPRAREAYLREHHADLPPEMAELAAAGEDAFDAAVSALAMSRHASDLQALQAVEDPTSLIEGEIWAPPALPYEPPATRAYGVRYGNALAYAAQLHGSQFRKGSRIPYVSHLLAVSSIVWEAGGDEDQAIAALLHDAVEDQGGQPTLERIRRRFGERVAAIVEACTDADKVPKPPWRERKEAHLARLEEAPEEAFLVLAADKLHNMRTLVASLRAHGPSTWEVFNGGRDGTLWYAREMLALLERRAARCPLLPQLAESVGQLEDVTGSPGTTSRPR
jgi:hypothetical protein